MLRVRVLAAVLIAEAFPDGNGFTAFKFQQIGTKIKAERFELARYNKVTTKQASIVSFKYAMNMTFMFRIDVGYDLQVVVQMYKFLSNEYRLFPMRFQINTCDGFKENAAGVGDFFKCGNFTGCPLKKNILNNVCNWTIDESKFPPLIPEGRYLMELQGLVHGTDVGLVRIYIEIARPIPIPK